MHHFSRTGRLAVLAGIMVLCQLGDVAAQSTDPIVFTTITEESSRRGTQGISITQISQEVNDQSIIVISFDETLMLPPSGGILQVQIRVEAFLVKGTTSTRVTPIDNYLSKDASGNPVFHDKPFNPGIGATIVPDTYLMLSELDAENFDAIQIRVTNLQTQESLVRVLMPRPFGFRVKVSDSLLFIKRRGVSDKEKMMGVDDFNFGAAPGVTYGGTFLSRGNNFWRFLQPGVGINVSFMDWDDPTFDLATGQFAQGTSSNDIEIGLGVQVSLMNNILQFTYGWNLQAEQDRSYFGVGVSFVNLSTRLTGLIAQ